MLVSQCLLTTLAKLDFNCNKGSAIHFECSMGAGRLPVPLHTSSCALCLITPFFTLLFIFLSVYYTFTFRSGMHVCRGLACKDDALQKLSGHPERSLGYCYPRRAAAERRGLDLRHRKPLLSGATPPKSPPKLCFNLDLDDSTSC